MTDVVLPRLSDSMEDGKILAWLKQTGDLVARGDELAEIETDKATVLCEAEGDGVLEIVVAEGATAEIGTVIAHLHAAGEQPSVTRAQPEAVRSTDDEPPITPPGEAPATVPMSHAQALVARRMAGSHSEVPDFMLEADVDMSEAVALYRDGKKEAEAAPTLNDMIVKACALALRDFPLANGSFKGSDFELHSHINIGIAVATDDSLIVPTVFDADRQTLGDIAKTTSALARKVREGTIAPAELAGATFTVSNLGMYGVRRFTAIINPPQAAILAVGIVAERPVVRDGRIEVRHIMAATLSCDHRIVYGAYGAQFLARIRGLLEHPSELGP